MSVVWEDPPPNPHARNVWWELLTTLQKQPLAWARVKAFKSAAAAHGAASQLRKRNYQYPVGRWEFTSAKFEDGGAVWARYLGPEEPK